MLQEEEVLLLVELQLVALLLPVQLVLVVLQEVQQLVLVGLLLPQLLVQLQLRMWSSQLRRLLSTRHTDARTRGPTPLFASAMSVSLRAQ